MRKSIHPSTVILFALLLCSVIIGGYWLTIPKEEVMPFTAYQDYDAEAMRSVDALRGDIQPVLGAALVDGFLESYSVRETIIRGGQAGVHVCPASLRRIVRFYARDSAEGSQRRIQRVLGQLVVMDAIYRTRHVPGPGMTATQQEWSDQQDRATDTVNRFLGTEYQRGWSESMEGLAIRVNLRPCEG